MGEDSGFVIFDLVRHYDHDVPAHIYEAYDEYRVHDHLS